MVLCSVLQEMVCLIVFLFILAMILSVLRFKVYDYFSIFKLILYTHFFNLLRKYSYIRWHQFFWFLQNVLIRGFLNSLIRGFLNSGFKTQELTMTGHVLFCWI